MTKQFGSDEQSEKVSTPEAENARLPLMPPEKEKKYWFVRKRYGWGWLPARWQGWAVLGIYTGSLVRIFWNIDKDSHSASDTLINFFLPLVGLTIILLTVTFLTGEKPRWQWGEDKKEKA